MKKCRKEGLEGKMDGARPTAPNDAELVFFLLRGAASASALLFMYCVPRQLFMTAWK